MCVCGGGAVYEFPRAVRSILKSRISVLCMWKPCPESKNMACVAPLRYFIVIIIYQHVGLGWIRGKELLHYKDFKAHVRIEQVSDSIEVQAFHALRDGSGSGKSQRRSILDGEVCAINVALTTEGILYPPNGHSASAGGHLGCLKALRDPNNTSSPAQVPSLPIQSPTPSPGAYAKENRL